MLFTFVWVGKTRNQQLRLLVDEYLQRLSRFVRCQVVEVRESASREPQVGLEDEGKRIASVLHTQQRRIVLLDLNGKQWSSIELAKEVERWQGSGLKEVAFVIGGHYGVSGEVASCANERWSLSRLTLTHEMARVLTIEQLYRAYTIVHRLPYQK